MRLLASILALGLAGCAQLHHVEVADIDNTLKGEAIQFTIMVSETGFSVDEAKGIINLFAKSSSARRGNDDVARYIELFQFGPATGKKVFNDTYAENIYESIIEKCPSGKITGLTAIRESTKYPVISGEIIRITGICYHEVQGV